MLNARAPTPLGHPLVWVDAVKGFAIISVVFGHAWRGCWAAGLFDNYPQTLFGAIDTRIYAFHMPLFFMVSGFFLVSSLRRYDPAAFVKSRLARLFWPMVLWSYIFMLSKLVAGPLANDPVAFSWQLLLPVPGQWQFWFLWALFLLHVGLLLLRPVLLSHRWSRAAMWGLLLLSLAAVTVHPPIWLLYWTNSAIYFLPYLAAGMLISAYGLLEQRGARAGLSGLSVAVVLIAIVPTLTSSPLPSALVSLAICLGIVATLSWASFALPRMGQVLAYFGQASMIIFLSHTLFSAPVRIVLIKAGIEDPTTHILVGTIAGLLAPLLLKYLIERTGKPALFGV